jgi:hypothetical protein
MIEQTQIDGQTATVAYLNDDMEPVDKDAATLVKVIFEDGRRVFMVPSDE